MNHLKINTKEKTLSLDGVELFNVREIGIRLHDDDRTTVTISLSPCEVDATIDFDKHGRNAWLRDT